MFSFDIGLDYFISFFSIKYFIFTVIVDLINVNSLF